MDGTAPTFVTKPTIRQDADGSTLVFHCSIYADPKPVVSWFHNGDKVQDNKKFQVSQLMPADAIHMGRFAAGFL